MESSELVSIIIPAYNHAAFLEKSVATALAQTYPQVEIVVVDDGSTDETRAVMERLGDKVRYVYQENQGLSAARNTGIRTAAGSYLVFLDADDLLFPHMVETALTKLKSLDDDFVVVATTAELVDETGEKIGQRFPRTAEDIEVSMLELLTINRFTVTALVKKSVFEECGYFDTALSAGEDRDMWIRVARRHRIYRLGESLHCIRRHGDNMSRDGRRQARAIRMVHGKAWQEGYLRGVKRLYWFRIKAFYYFQCSQLYSAVTAVRPFGFLFLSFLLWPYFGNCSSLEQSRWFRLRTGLWLLGAWNSRLAGLKAARALAAPD